MDSTACAAKAKPRRIVVSSNCQTGGIAAALQVIFPDDLVIPVPMPSGDDHAHLADQLRTADAWVSIGRFDLAEPARRPAMQVVRIPKLIFSAFHPDLVRARRRSTGGLVTPPCNSAIVVWAYRHRVAACDVAHLFNEATFRELGYLDRWDDSTTALARVFRESDLDFRRFYLAMRRQGVFMNTSNHPKASALATVAKLVALKLGADADIMDRTIEINDGLAGTIWPVYPAIGASLALPSSDEWKLEQGKVIRGTHAYVESSYHSFRMHDVPPDDLVAVAFRTAPPIDDALYDHVLGSHLRGAA